MTCSSLLHKELWWIFEENQWPSNQGHVTPKSNFPSWKHGKTYSSMLPVSNDTKFMLVTRNANDFTSETWLIASLFSCSTIEVGLKRQNSIIEVVCTIILSTRNGFELFAWIYKKIVPPNKGLEPLTLRYHRGTYSFKSLMLYRLS